jgi:RES domain-containing protein
MQNTIVRRQLSTRIVVAVVLLGIASVVIYVIRTPILRAAGWMLVVNDHVEPADVIVVTVEADGAGTLEAADLVHSGVAKRVAVFGEPPDAMVQREFIRRGIAYEDAAARSVRQLRALGVDTVDLIPTYVAGSEDEGPVLASWCDQHGYRFVVVVSTSDHSRRLRRILRRSMKGHQMRVTAHSARYSAFDPDRWWQSRRGIRTEVAELQKLLLDVVCHPIP